MMYDIVRITASFCHFQCCPLEIGSALAENVGQGEVSGCTCRVPAAWLCLGSAVGLPWLALGGPFLSFLAFMDLETSCLTLQGK